MPKTSNLGPKPEKPFTKMRPQEPSTSIPACPVCQKDHGIMSRAIPVGDGTFAQRCPRCLFMFQVPVSEREKERIAAAGCAGFDEGWNAATSETLTDAEREIIRDNGRRALKRIVARAREDEAKWWADNFAGCIHKGQWKGCKACDRLAAVRAAKGGRK